MIQGGNTDVSLEQRKSILVISALDIRAVDESRGMPSVSETVRGYVRHSWEVTYITGNRAPTTVDALIDGVRMIRFNIPWLTRLVNRRKTGVFARPVWWLWFQVVTFFKARSVRSQCKPDVIYAATIYGVPIGKVLSALWRVPMVSRFYGTAFMPSHIDRKLSRIRFWMYILAYRIPTDLVIMTNDGTQGDRVLERMGVDAKRVRFWMNGIDRERFGNPLPKSEARRRLNITAQHVLLTVSRLAGWKRVERNINALPEVVVDFPDTVLIVVGEGDQRARLARLARDLSVERHVRFEGGVLHHEVPLYLAAADLFLSLYDLSNVGNPLLEAMTAGKCVITLNNGDTGRFVRNEDNGVLLEYELLSQLPSVIKALLADERRQETLGANARRFAEENFWTWEKRIDVEVATVSSLLARKSPGMKRN